MRLLTAITIGFGLASLPAFGQEGVSSAKRAAEAMADKAGAQADKSDKPDTISTDRPNFTNSPGTVGKGHWQIESGYTYSHSSTGQTSDFGQVSMRYGLKDKFEVQIKPGSYLWQKDSGQNSSGWGGPYLGIKMSLKEGAEKLDWSRPSIGILAGTTVPIGSSSVSEHAFQPQATLATSWNLTDKVTFGTNVVVAHLSNGGTGFTQCALGGALGYQICAKCSTWLDAYTLMPGDPHGPNRHFVDTGLSYLLDNNTQLDFLLGMGLNSTKQEYFIGGGYSKRF